MTATAIKVRPGDWAVQLLNEETGQFETSAQELRLSEAWDHLNEHDGTRRLMKAGRVILTIHKLGTAEDFTDDPERLF